MCLDEGVVTWGKDLVRTYIWNRESFGSAASDVQSEAQLGQYRGEDVIRLDEEIVFFAIALSLAFLFNAES